MSLTYSLLLLLNVLYLLPPASPFTVIMSDSGVPSALVDAPQTGFSMNNNGARTDPREQEAVYDVMRATGNDWATEIPDVCRGRWHGIECMPDKDNVYHVVSLSFGALSDDTAFPTCDPTRSHVSPSITKLPHLRTLFFYRCFTHNPQPIPSVLGQLGPTLQTLVLRENGHVGPIPTELGNLTRLKVLDLHRNNLNGSIPVSLGRIAGLRSLDLSGNRLTGLVPNFSFPVLNVWDMNQNLLTGPIPFSLGTCTSLLKLDWSHNRLISPLPESISNLKNLMLMDLSYNRLSNAFPSSLGDLISLQALILRGNPIDSATIPTNMFDRMRNLMILILSSMNLHGPIPSSLGQLPNLHVVHLDRNRLNGSIPSSFQNSNRLSELRLNDNQLTGPVPFGREMVWRMKRKLRVYNNSGLCYEASSGFEDGLDSSYDSGIGVCDSPRAGSGRTVQHVSSNSIDGDGINSVNVSSATAVVVSDRVVCLVQLMFYLLFISNLL